LQVEFYHNLKRLQSLYLHSSLKETILDTPVRLIDSELAIFVPEKCLRKLASFSLRGESIFATPFLLSKNPYLLGYYRLLYGYSQKEFYSKGPFGIFRNMEEKGTISANANDNLDKLCRTLCLAGAYLVDELDDFSLTTLRDLQLLTIGPQFRGAKNNVYGQIATRKTFDLIRTIVGPYVEKETDTVIEITNSSGRQVRIEFSADPDIQIIEQMPSTRRPLISIEIKGGRDLSNIHNRIGESEKSHQKAKRRGFFEFMTIVSVDMSYDLLKQESPTTTHFFNLDKILDSDTDEFALFRETLSSILGIK